jgi:hypothetical protein
MGKEESTKPSLERKRKRRNDGEICDAAYKGDLDAVMRLYEDGVDLDSTTIWPGDTALMKASLRGQTSIVDYLIKNGASVDIKNTHGETALIKAVQYNQENSLKQLIASNANLNVIHNFGFTALMEAVIFDYRGCLAQLLLNGADDTIVFNNLTAFQIAVEKNRPYGVEDAWEGMKGKLKDPRFIDKHSDIYKSFATGVARAFSLLPEGPERNNKPIDFFMSFVNAGLSEPWSRERAIAMMKVLVNDMKREYYYGGEYAVINPLRLNLSTLEYDAERDLVSFAVADGRRKSVKKKQKRSLKNK